jgi:hypothetical protein
MRKESVVAYFKVISHNFLAEAANYSTATFGDISYSTVQIQHHKEPPCFFKFT